MNKAAYLLAGVAMSALLAGCGDTKEEVADCVFPDAPGTAAPGWVCDEPVEGVEVSAVGSADKSGAGHDFMKQMAGNEYGQPVALNPSTQERENLPRSLRVHPVGRFVQDQQPGA